MAEGTFNSSLAKWQKIKMGRKNRERIKEIKAGRMVPRRAAANPRPVYYRCLTCRHIVIESGLEKHKEECKTRGFKIIDVGIRR